MACYAIRGVLQNRDVDDEKICREALKLVECRNLKSGAFSLFPEGRSRECLLPVHFPEIQS